MVTVERIFFGDGMFLSVLPPHVPNKEDEQDSQNEKHDLSNSGLFVDAQTILTYLLGENTLTDPTRRW